MELKETANLMVSSDYKERFKAEYYQFKIRLEKLKRMLQKWDNKELSFISSCPMMLKSKVCKTILSSLRLKL